MNVISPWIITILKLKFRNKGSECMSRFTLDDYYGQRQTLTRVLSQERGKKIDLEGKISRLRSASTTLGNNLTAIEESSNTLGNLAINESQWRGAEKNKFDKNFQALQNYTKEFMNKTEDAKIEVEAELNRCETSLASIEASISRFEASLANVNAEIAARSDN